MGNCCGKASHFQGEGHRLDDPSSPGPTSTPVRKSYGSTANAKPTSPQRLGGSSNDKSTDARRKAAEAAEARMKTSSKKTSLPSAAASAEPSSPTRAGGGGDSSSRTGKGLADKLAEQKRKGDAGVRKEETERILREREIQSGGIGWRNE